MSFVHVVPIVTVLGVSLACRTSRLEPPLPAPAQQTSTSIAASVEITWQAVVSVFAARRIPIRTLDREGGRIVAGPIAVNAHGGPTWGDCGRLVESWEARPANAEVRVESQSEGHGSAIRITTRWTAVDWDVTRQCETRGDWEQELERQVRQEAERAGKGR